MKRENSRDYLVPFSACSVPDMAAMVRNEKC
jgi:hypothetical protein